MPVSKEQLAAIIGGKAREMCSPQNDKKYNAMAGRINMDENYDPYNNPDPSMYDGDADRFDAMYSFSASEGQRSRDMQYNQSSAAASRMPEAIKQSMLQERIDVSSLGGTSVLDTLHVKPQRKPAQQRAPQQSMITEASQYAVQQPVGGVDYSIIKMIVNECLNEYFSKQPLNESNSLKTIGLSGGNISLVDNKGNVYKAKLEKIGNKNDKQ